MADTSSPIHGFQLQREQEIPELRSTARQFVHTGSGARLIHLANDDPNNLFSIAFRTPVFDDTGVPHILEHSVLGGSRKFPIKDPFQILLKGSLQTFLNALTYADRTVYPVASQVEKDFYNLVDVYCDAGFHPLLTENTFSQEGWHFDVDTPEGPVNIKGIVYNEMKGVFSDFNSHVIRKTVSALFPDTTYFYESGGEPEHITDLTYEQFKQFHARYYHPSNSFIFLYGNLPTEKTLAFLDGNYLSEYDRIEVDSHVPAQRLWNQSRTVEIEAPAAKQDEGTATVLLNWICGNATDPQQMLTATMLSRYLLGTESAPLRRALIDSGLGEDIDDMSGFDSELVQGVFSAGLRKSRPEHAEKIRSLVLDTLKKQVEGEFDRDLMEASIRRTEFNLREVSGNRFPYALRLADRCYRSWLYDGDPLSHLAFESPLNAIKQAHAGGDSYFTNAMREMFLDNGHLLVSVVKASHRMAERIERQTNEQIEQLAGSFTAEDLQRYHALTQKLLEQQKAQPTEKDLECMPKLDKADLPPKNKEVAVEQTTCADAPTYLHPLFTSGISYLDIGFDCTGIPADLTMYLPLFAEIMTRCGAAGLDYRQMSKRTALATGGLGAGIMLDESVATPREMVFKCFFHGKSLTARFGEMRDIFADLFRDPGLDDTTLIRNVVLEMRNSLKASVVGNGAGLAATYAASRLNATQKLSEMLEGITQLRFLDSLARRDASEQIVDRIRQLHRHLIACGRVMLSLTADTPAEHMQACEELLGTLPEQLESASATMPAVEKTAELKPVGVEIPASVNFVSKAWRLRDQEAADLGLLSLLGMNLSRGYLWDKVRVEGGAYGAWASVGSNYPVFGCASYRDPNLTYTLESFEGALRYAAEQIDTASVDESIVGTIGRVDKPKTPHGYGYGETRNLLLGRSREYRQRVRDGILRATPELVRKKAAEIIQAAQTSVAVLGSASAFDKAAGEGVALQREQLLEGE